MIREVQALQASDGKMFLAEQAFEALEYEARTALEKCIGKPCSTEIMSKVLAVHEAIAPLVAEIKERRAAALDSATTAPERNPRYGAECAPELREDRDNA